MCFQPAQTLRQILIRPKDPTPALLKNGTVCKVPCKVCSKAYVGQSGRLLECRLKEHQHAVRNGDVAASAIAEHAWKSDHWIDWERAHVLDSCRYLYARCMLESWHIHQLAEPLNRERGPLPNIVFITCPSLSSYLHVFVTCLPFVPCHYHLHVYITVIMVAVICVMTSVNDHCLHNWLSVVFFCCLTLVSIYTTCLHPPPFPDDVTHMTVEMSDQS